MCFCSANFLFLEDVSKLSYFDSQFSRIYKSATNVTMSILLSEKRMFAKKMIMWKFLALFDDFDS